MSKIEFVQNVYHVLKECEIEVLINQSGSTKSDQREKNRAGQSYLYKKEGMESEVFEVRFHDRVEGSALNQALIKAIKRYPYFNTKFVEKNGDFYIVQNPVGMIAKNTKKLARLGGVHAKKNLFDVTYYGKSVYISFHHALCDGRGIKPFIETLIYYYCSSKYRNEEIIEGIHLEDSPLLEGETIDPFLHFYEVQEEECIEISRDGYRIPENVMTDEQMNYRYEVCISKKDFIKVCKENNATPAILLSLLMSKGIAVLYPDFDKPINSNIASDMREALGVPNTYKNCVKSMILPYGREFKELSLIEQATEYRNLLKLQKKDNFCKKEANAIVGLYTKLDEHDSFEAKQQMMSFFESDKYVKAFLEQANHLNITCETSECIPFLTPKDHVRVRNR